MDNREQTSPAQGENTRGYTVDELLAQMEPQYRAYKNTMRQCIAGLTEHAARLAAQGQEEQLPTFRRLLTDMAEFWGLAEDDTPKDAYENTDPDAYKALVAELKKGITYGEGVDYPYEWDEVEEYLPRLCEKYLEPCAVEFHLKSHHTIWFSDCPDIQKAREGGPPQRNGPQTDIKMEGM